MPYQLVGFGSVCSISTFPAPHDQDWTLLRRMIITLIDEVKNLDVSPDVNDSIEDVNDFWSRAPPLLL